jgi:sugar lactone lactonase YvrE
VDHFQFPSGRSFRLINAMVNGPDGLVWATDFGGHILRLSPDGQATDFPLPPSWSPRAIALGPDGALWFTADSGGEFANLMVRMSLNWAKAEDGQGLVDQPWGTQQMFSATWGADAERRWSEEHDREMRTGGR